MHSAALALTHHYFDDEPTMPEARPWHRLGLAIVDDEPTVMRAPRPYRPHVAEPIESLSLPAGLREEMLPLGATPRTPQQARVWLVRLARDLARDYRLWYGFELRTDAIAVEKMQWHLATAVVAIGRRDEKALARELVRHGLVLGEIFTRALGASWVDLSGDRPGQWELFVPPAATVSPVLRVQRFVEQGMNETDLVALYLDLDAAQRRG